MRWVRLIAGVFALFSFVQKLNSNLIEKVDYLILAAGIYFLYKALFNSGCEATHYNNPRQADDTTTIDYEEIK